MDRMRFTWSKFEKSGKIADYMAFCEERRRSGLLPCPASDGADADCAEPHDQSSV